MILYSSSLIALFLQDLVDTQVFFCFKSCELFFVLNAVSYFLKSGMLHLFIITFFFFTTSLIWGKF
jgi:hypothetical protein